MTATGFSLARFATAIAILGAWTGCAAPPPGNGSGGVLPPDGTLGGACLSDGTCAPGLVCSNGICTSELAALRLLIFQNNSGPMCLAALAWLEDLQQIHPALVVEQHLTTAPAGRDLLLALEAQYPGSEGVSDSFAYLPIIFFQGHAYSGFNDAISQSLEALCEPEEVAARIKEAASSARAD